MGTPHNATTPILPVAPATRNPTGLPLLTEADAARLLGVSPQYLVKWRFLGRPAVPFVRIGTRTIRYCVADIDAYIEHRTVGRNAPATRQREG